MTAHMNQPAPMSDDDRAELALWINKWIANELAEQQSQGVPSLHERGNGHPSGFGYNHPSSLCG